MIKKISLITLLTFSFLNASESLKPILQMGYDFGGTTLARVEHEGSYSSSVNKIRAGQGLSFEGGAVLDTRNMELQFLVGYKFDEESASNGDVTWDVIPFTALVMMKTPYNWNFGGGVTYHLNPKIDGSFSGDDRDGNHFNDNIHDEYEDAIGGVVQIEYMATENFRIGIKGTFIEYKQKDDNTIKARGNSVGINLSYRFGGRSQFR